MCLCGFVCCFFNAPATTEIYTLSLHDALPILESFGQGVYTPRQIASALRYICRPDEQLIIDGTYFAAVDDQLRSEEHTSELQSRQYLVCRLLLEKKKHTK